jgi:succinate dehydrogenase/fumarate reductase flavoprotein subunit
MAELSWDLSFDVVVAGYGYAGAMAAIAAHDAGAKVLLLEKSPHPGGASIMSAGGVIVAQDAERAFNYLKIINAGTTPDDVLRCMAQGMAGLPAFLERFAADVDASVEFGAAGDGPTYPLPGGETLFFAKISSRSKLAPFPWLQGGLRGGTRLFRVVVEHVERRGIETRCGCAALRLITSPSGEVVGILAQEGNRTLRIRAERGVVLATGGFENSPELRRQFFRAAPVYPLCTLSNTGDGILMAQKAGAALWHMWHFHGSYGFKVPDYPFAFRSCLRGSRSPRVVVPWILVDQKGRRFANEYPRAVQDTGARDLDHLDPETATYPRIPAYAIFDEPRRQMGPIADVIINDESYPPFTWSADNAAEIARGWIHQANTLAELAKQIGVPAETLEKTVSSWNATCEAGEDPEFGRQRSSMAPIAVAPFCAAPVWPIVTNTQGGPVHDVEQRVVDAFGDPIARLYAAGELGSIYGSIYQLSGNITECFVGGQIAGRNAALAPAWS